MRNDILIRRLLCAAIILGAQWATLGATAGVLRGSLRLKGNPTAVILETRQTSVASALAALASAYHISIRSTIVLDEQRDGTYTGSLRYVIARLLDGYNYVIEENNAAALDVFVVGRSDGKATPAPTMPVFRQHRIPVTYRISRVRP